jgi:hypothetical protein
MEHDCVIGANLGRRVLAATVTRIAACCNLALSAGAVLLRCVGRQVWAVW